MADIDIDPFGEHESRTEEPTDENIPLTPVTPGRSTWEPEREHETSFGSPEVLLSRGEILHKEYLVGEIYELIGNKTHQRLEPNLGLFEIDKDGRLYYKGKPLMNRNGELKTIGVIVDTLGIRRLREMGYNIAKTNLKPRLVLDLLEKQAELPSSSEIAKADDMELEEIAEKASDILSQMKIVQTDTDDLFEHPLQELLGLDKQLRNIRGSLKVEVAKKVQLEEHIGKEHRKLEEFREYPGVYDDAMREDITKRIDALNDELATRQESIDLLKGRLKNQITSFKEAIAKVLDKDTSLQSVSWSLAEFRHNKIVQLLRENCFNVCRQLQRKVRSRKHDVYCLLWEKLCQSADQAAKLLKLGNYRGLRVIKKPSLIREC